MLEPKGRNDSHVFDYSKIEDLVYVGSDLCRGRNCPSHDKEFRSLGIRVELNLSAEKKEIPPDDVDIYSWIPVVDGYAPSQDQLDIGAAIINQAISNKNVVYVHCKNGHGRSPTMVAAFLIKYKGMGVGEAINSITQKRPEIHIEDSQRKALEEFKLRWSR